MAPANPRMRSRTGCVQCRRRRKKCCEQKPVCKQCRRIGRACSFSNLPAPSPDSACEVDTDILSSEFQPCVIAFRCLTETVRIAPVMGQSKEICALLQFHSAEGSPNSHLPTIPDIVLELLPVVADSTMAIAAVSAILALFMPMEWIQRTQSPLRLSQQAIRQLSTALADCPLATASDTVLLTAKLLYLFQLHSEPVAIQACSHLRAVGIMLQQRLQQIDSGSLFSVPVLEDYLYHMIVNSTVNFEIVTNGVTPSIITKYFEEMSRQQDCPITDLKLLGISAYLMLDLFHLSWLRRDVLSSPHATMRFAVCQSGEEKESKRSKLPIEPACLDILYTYACSLFRSLIIDQVTTSGWLPNMKNKQICDESELEKAIDFVCSEPMPYHVVTWPLLVIGLASRPGALRGKIAECFKKVIDNSRLISATSSFEFLKAAWTTHQGLSSLLSPTLEKTLIF